jgi:hypothetical protein
MEGKIACHISYTVNNYLKKDKEIAGVKDTRENEGVTVGVN